METITVYIGSNNDTKQLELDRIKNVCNIRHDGYTLYTATGAWLGSEEDTAVLIIHDQHDQIMGTITALKKVLQQDAIGYQISPPLQFA